MIVCMVLMAGIRFRKVTMRQATIAVFVLSYFVYGLIEYSKGAFSPSVVVCLSSLLFATIGLPMLLIMFALDKWVSRKNQG
jgi:hypothetical protein